MQKNIALGDKAKEQRGRGCEKAEAKLNKRKKKIADCKESIAGGEEEIDEQRAIIKSANEVITELQTDIVTSKEDLRKAEDDSHDL